MWKHSFRQGGIPLLYCKNPALLGQNFPIQLLQPASAEWKNYLTHTYKKNRWKTNSPCRVEVLFLHITTPGLAHWKIFHETKLYMFFKEVSIFNTRLINNISCFISNLLDLKTKILNLDLSQESHSYNHTRLSALKFHPGKLGSRKHNLRRFYCKNQRYLEKTGICIQTSQYSTNMMVVFRHTLKSVKIHWYF